MMVNDSPGRVGLSTFPYNGISITWRPKLCAHFRCFEAPSLAMSQIDISGSDPSCCGPRGIPALTFVWYLLHLESVRI